MKRFLFRGLLLGLISILFIAGLITGFYLVFGQIQSSAWSAVLTEMKARGEPISPLDYIPTPVSDENNFCAVPLLACINDYDRSTPNDEPLHSNPEMVAKITGIKLEEKDNPDLPLFGSVQKKERTELSVWQAYFQASGNFPHSSTSANPGTSVLKALSRFQNEIDELRMASQKPDARFQVHYDETFRYSILLPQLGVSLNLCRVIALRASAFLQTGNTSEALKDLQILFKLHQALEKEPFLISHLVSGTILNTAMSVIWEGMEAKAWPDSDLKEISGTLSPYDFLEQYQRVMRAEYVFSILPTIDLFKTDGGKILATALETKETQGATPLFRIIPHGFYDQTKIAAVYALREKILPVTNIEKHRYFLEKASELDKFDKTAYSSHWPSDMILGLLSPISAGGSRKMVETQSLIDMARIACVLELYQRRNGQYPDSLDSLKQNLPHDIVSGNPYLYKQTPNGRYQLWSVGCNGTDEGGKTFLKKPGSKNLDLEQGDIVWAYPDK